MKSPKLLQVIGGTGAIFLASFGTSAQVENPPPVKGRWGLSAGVFFDNYKHDPFWHRGMKVGISPMITYTRGKNQFEIGPQFQFVRQKYLNQYLGINFNYKRYFNGFGNKFVPYLYSGIAFSTSKSELDFIGAGGPYSDQRSYKQAGVNLSIGYGLEWQLGEHLYIGSAVGLNPGFYSVTRTYENYWGAGMNPVIEKSTMNHFGLNFNVNAQIGYRFGK